jgi:hypothetical protein
MIYIGVNRLLLPVVHGGESASPRVLGPVCDDGGGFCFSVCGDRCYMRLAYLNWR